MERRREDERVDVDLAVTAAATVVVEEGEEAASPFLEIGVCFDFDFDLGLEFGAGAGVGAGEGVDAPIHDEVEERSYDIIEEKRSQ